MTPREVTTYLLAGGKSTRFGSDKALLKIDGRWALEILLDGLGPELADAVFVSGPPRAALAALKIRGFVEDVLPDQGPLGGVAACLAQCPTPVALFVACDMPYSATVARALIGPHDPQRVPATAYAGYPLPMAISTALAADAFTRLTGEDRSLMGFLASLEVNTLPLPDDAERAFHNINRPADLD